MSPSVCPTGQLSASADLEMAEDTTSRIVRQPVEVVVKIAAYLSTGDVCALRLTCRAMDHLLGEFFLRNCFRAKQFWMHEASLQALVDMSTHPTISRELKHVALGTDYLRVQPAYLTDPDVDIQPFTSAQIQQLHHLLASHDHMQHTGADMAMLSEAFSRLPNLQTFSIRDFDNSKRSSRYRMAARETFSFWDDIEIFDSYGAKSVSRATGRHVTTDRIASGFQTRGVDDYTIGAMFSKALAALANANARPGAIEVIVKDLSWALCDRAFYIPAPMQPSFALMLSKLTKLHLDLCICKDVPYPISQISRWKGREAINFSPLLQKFLSLTPRLTWLRLGLAASEFVTNDQLLRWLAGDPGGTFGDSDRFPQPVRFAHLEHLEIMGKMSCDVLMQVVQRLAATLRKLNLRGVTFVVPGWDAKYEVGVWSRFLRFLADETDLRSFRFSQAKVSLGRDDTVEGAVSYIGRSFDGGHTPNNMKLYLEDLADKLGPNGDDDMDEYVGGMNTFSDSNSEEEEEDDDDEALEVDYGEDSEYGYESDEYDSYEFEADEESYDPNQELERD